MISNQIIQTSIEELKTITKVELCVFDLNGQPVATTMHMEELDAALIAGFAHSPADSQVMGLHHLLKVMDEGETVNVLVARGPGDDVYMIGKIKGRRAYRQTYHVAFGGEYKHFV